jgi:glycine betaine/proline transport system ATP-binding protein
MTKQGEEMIRLNSVYKIFGPQPRGRAFELSSAGLDKNEVQRQTGHVVGLTDVSFEVKKGEIFVVMGLSGSGKSTAIRTVNKLHDVTHGEVIVDGTDVQQLDGKALQAFRREKMGMVFQHFALFPHRNIIDNVGYGLKVQKV